MARRDIAYTPQEQALFQDLTVEQNLRLGLRDDRRFARRPRAGRPAVSVPARAPRRSAPARSPGGEQKMLLVARALMSEPQLMLIDEITEGLQPSVIERLAAVLRAERDESKVSILLIEQNVKFALAVADRYAVLKLGEIVDRGQVGGARARGAHHGSAERMTFSIVARCPRSGMLGVAVATAVPAVGSDVPVRRSRRRCGVDAVVGESLSRDRRACA